MSGSWTPGFAILWAKPTRRSAASQPVRTIRSEEGSNNRRSPVPSRPAIVSASLAPARLRPSALSSVSAPDPVPDGGVRSATGRCGMIRANLRQRLTSDDLDLSIDLLGHGRAAGRRYFAELLTDEGPDRLLDQPELPGLLLRAPRLNAPSAPLFFYVLVRHGLKGSGIDDMRLSDYLGSLLLEFGLGDRAGRISDHDDETRRYVVDLLADLGTARGQRAFLILAHQGNWSLWLAGVFP